MTWDDAGQDDSLEARAEVLLGMDRLSKTQEARAVKVREAAPLRARRDTFDARRKSHRGLVLAKLNAERAGPGEKELPATLAETIASGHPDYVAFLDKAEAEFTRLAILEDEIAALTERINRDQRLLQWATVERYNT